MVLNRRFVFRREEILDSLLKGGVVWGRRAIGMTYAFRPPSMSFIVAMLLWS